MLRSIVTLTIGAVIGAAAATWLVATSDHAVSSVLATPDPAAIAAERGRLTSATVLLSPDVAEVADPRTLESEIARLALEPQSLQRDLSLEALVVHLLEMDAPHAVRIVQNLDLDDRFLVPLFRRWAEIDAGAALNALANIDGVGKVRAIALELLGTIGADQRSLDRLAQLMPNGNRVNFELAALEHRVKYEPERALADAVALSDAPTRQRAVLRIGFEWGNRDPGAALTALEFIPDRQDRREYFNFVLTRWARLDPGAALRYAVTADEDNLEASFFAIQTIINRVPGDVIAVADQFPPLLRSAIESYSARVLAEQNPAEAITVAQGLPRGQLRYALLQQANARLPAALP